jgi:hypothetical protein
VGEFIPMICKHFLIQQLVPPTVFEALGEKAWDLLDPHLLTTIDQLYEYFGPMTINNWATGGKFKESGFREQNTTTGAPNSMHKKGKAADCKPVKCSPQFMYAEILKDPSRFPLLTTMENITATTTGPATGWVHVDVRPATQTGIRIVNP